MYDLEQLQEFGRKVLNQTIQYHIIENWQS
jgi:hypothetical protein